MKKETTTPQPDSTKEGLNDSEFAKDLIEGAKEVSQRLSKEGLHDKHTPGEWKVQFTKDGYNGNIWITSDNKKAGFVIASLERSAAVNGANEEAEANAELIVKAVNSHHSLVDALRDELEYLEEWNGNGNNTKRIEKIKTALNNTK